MVKTPIIREPFSKIAIDIAGPLSRTKKGNKYILIVIDEGTRYYNSSSGENPVSSCGVSL
jgi:hypothetical protein